MEFSAFLSQDASGLPKPHFSCQISNGGLCDACQNLEHLDSRVAEAKAVLKGLVHRHHQVRTEINQIHSPMLQRIPPEIASSIFESCVAAESCDLFLKQTTQVQISAPLVLGAVCRSWRQIVWETPRLWTCLSISFDPRKFPERCELMQEWLGRSGQLPLSINVYCDPFRPVPTKDYSILLPAIEILNQYSARWQYLSLSIPCFYLSQFVANSRVSSSFVLKTLQLFPSDALETSEEGHFISVNAKPNPTKIKTSFMRFKAVDIEWNNATRVELDWLHLDECLELLQRAPKLTHCTLDEVKPPHDHFPLPVAPIFCNSLQVLVFSAYYPELATFFDKLLAPALEDLAYFDNDGGGPLPSESLSAFMQRSACRLQVLYIQGVMADDEDLFALLREAPSLRHLTLSPGVLIDHFPNNFFELLGTTSMISSDPHDIDGQKAFLPKLQSLKYLATEQPFDWHIFSKIFGPISNIEDPRRRPLQTAELLFYQPEEDSPFPYIDQDALLRIQGLQDAGIHLKFTVDGKPLVHKVR